MKRLATIAVCISIALIARGTYGGNGAAFEITLGPHASEVPLGIPVQIMVNVRNASGQPLTVGWHNTPLRMDVRGEDDVPLERCPWDRWSAPYVAVPQHWHGTQLPADWKMSRLEPICFDHVGAYRAKFTISSQGPYKNQEGEEFDAWEGTASSPVLAIHVTEPEGVDKRAYEYFDGDPVPFSDRAGRLGDLLRRFPTSTYAAYVVWEYSAKGITHMSADELISYVAGNIDLIGNSVPDQSGSWQDYTGEAFLRWRDDWSELILQHHPQIGIGDELRFVTALDRYLLGDKDGCAVGLEDLAEHGKPYVASKAGELLAAMKAKGMLGEKAK
jgi:hypothetical protein